MLVIQDHKMELTQIIFLSFSFYAPNFFFKLKPPSLSFCLSVFLHHCECVCECVYVCVCMGMHTTVNVWKSEDNLRCPPCFKLGLVVHMTAYLARGFFGIYHVASHLTKITGLPDVYKRLHIDSGVLNSGLSVLIREPSPQAHF